LPVVLAAYVAVGAMGIPLPFEVAGRALAFFLSLALLPVPLVWVEQAVGTFSGGLPGGRFWRPLLAGIILTILVPVAVLGLIPAAPLLGFGSLVSPFLTSRAGALAGATFGALVIAWAAALFPLAWAI
jgi:hypothetical protein